MYTSFSAVVKAARHLADRIMEDGTAYMANRETGTLVRGAARLVELGIIERLPGEHRRHYRIVDKEKFNACADAYYSMIK